ncbi:MAG TPA: ferrous iron transport protein B [Bacteroidia bacterium]|nr:ferrous iron transport protein B [Bacteroidia bacterium]
MEISSKKEGTESPPQIRTKPNVRITRRIKVALVGNPNSGKSTLFNALTGLNQKIANFPGVTVEKKTGICTAVNSSGETVHAEIIDLPGTYSLYPKTPDEQIPFGVLCDPGNESYPDITIIIADGTNLKRSLFLCSQIVDLKAPVIIAINMIDLMSYKGIRVDYVELSKKLGIRIFPISARKNIGIEELKNALTEPVPVQENDFIDSKKFAPEAVEGIRKEIQVNSNYGAFQIANNFNVIKWFDKHPEKKEKIKSLLSSYSFDSTQLQASETLERYKVITEVMAGCVKVEEIKKRPQWSKGLDNILTHPVWGYVIFLAVLFLIFQAIFSWAKYPMDFIDGIFADLGSFVHNNLPQGVLNDLLVNGIIAGLAGIIIFVPQIALLFAFIAILEDTGYMARVSFIMDRIMRRYGLNGRSVIPLISGVACAVPAILSTRTIQSWKQRIVTIMVTPLMSCSARLPVYTLIISIIIPSNPVWGIINRQGLVLMSLYLIGFFAAIGSAFLMKWFVKARNRDYFIMELPLYHIPRWSNVGITIYDKVKIFLFDAGKVIIAISIILWFLSSRGPGEQFNSVQNKIDSLRAENNVSMHADEMNRLQALQLETSYAGKMGKWLEPAIKPLGFDWKIGIALVTSFAAREVFVGTMSTIYSAGNENKEDLTVRDKMMAEINPETGEPRYTVAVGWSLMLFYAFAMQCMSTLAVVKRETGGWKWPIIQFIFMGALAYLSSLAIFEILK